jgi:hypothetical protein
VLHQVVTSFDPASGLCRAYFEPQRSEGRPADGALIDGILVLRERYQTSDDLGIVGDGSDVDVIPPLGHSLADLRTSGGGATASKIVQQPGLWHECVGERVDEVTAWWLAWRWAGVSVRRCRRAAIAKRPPGGENVAFAGRAGGSTRQTVESGPGGRFDEANGKDGPWPGRSQAARTPRLPTAPRRPTHPMQPTQSSQSMHPTHPTHRRHFRQPKQAMHPLTAALNSVSTLPATATLPAVPTLPATATLPAVATLPATATLPAVAALPATATLPAVARLPATATLPAVARLPATATLLVVVRLPATARLPVVSRLPDTAVLRRVPALPVTAAFSSESEPGSIAKSMNVTLMTTVSR